MQTLMQVFCVDVFITFKNVVIFITNYILLQFSTITALGFITEQEALLL